MTEVNGKDELAARIGAAVRERRKTAGKTLSSVAQAAGMSVSHLSNVENGLTLVSLPMLAKLAAALDTSLAELTRDDNFVFRGSSMPTEPGRQRVSHPALAVEADGLALQAGESRTIDHLGERDLFVFVTEGEMEVVVDGEHHVLGAGDALDARSPASAVLTANRAARVFCATVPAVRTS